jgi:DNA repair exonuclease SbcCD ATPase subunit
LIVLRLEVSGFRCWRDSVAVEFHPEQVNILHGPNGSGKSTLLWALARALLDTHRAGGRAVEELRPWGAGLAPTIIVEFEHGGRRYRLRKGFLENRHAGLEEYKDGRFLALAEYEKAEDAVREMLLAERAPRELAAPERWGLARALWCPQDHLAIDALDERVLGAVRQVLGQTGLDEYASRLKRQVKDAYLEYWTPTGRAKGGRDAPKWVQLAGNLAGRRQELVQAQSTLEEFHRAQEKARELEAARTAAEQRLDSARRRVEELEKKFADWRRASEVAKISEAQWQARRQEAAALHNRGEQLNKLRERLGRLEARIREIDAELPAKQAARQELETAVASLRRELEALQADEERLASRDKLLTEAENYARHRAEREELERLLGCAADLSNRLREAQETLQTLGAPDDSTLTQIEKLAVQQTQLEIRLEGALLHVELHPRESRRVEVIRGDPPGPLEVAAGASLRIRGSPIVELDLEGFGRLVVSGPAEGGAELKAKLAELAERLASLKAPYGAAGLDELRRRREQRLHLEAGIAHTRRELDALLAGRTPDALGERLNQIRVELQHLEALYPDWGEAPPDVPQLRSALAADRAALQDRRRSLETERETLQARLTELGQDCARLAAERDALAAERRQAETQIKELESDGLSDADRADRARAAAVEAIGFEERYRRELAALQALGPDPAPELDRTRLDRQAAEQEFQSASQDYHHHLGVLANLSTQAPFEAVVHLEEEIERLSAEIESDRRRAEALKRLHDEIAACEALAGRALVEPVAQRASKLLTRITGDHLRSVRLGDGLSPESVLPRDAGAEAALEALSAGEREQVHFAVRLALAELLTRDAGERHLVALDDVLVVTDDGRLGRVLELLEELRPYAQLVILTCHPDRYRSLPRAHFIDAAALSQPR